MSNTESLHGVMPQSPVVPKLHRRAAGLGSATGLARRASLFTAFLLCALLLPLAHVVQAATAASVVLSPTSGAPGTVVTVEGTGFPKYARGTVTAGTSSAPFTTGRGGRFSAKVTVPSASSAGGLAVTATSGAVVARASFEVTAPASTSPTPPTALWRPAPGTTWQWQLTSAIDQTVDAAVYDVDLFDTSAATVASLHGAGRRVICYVSAGSFEDWRADAASFPTVVLGKSNGWVGERWLDIRRLDLLAPIMEARLDLCRAKGFDAVEPDNVDGYANDSGFALTAADQLTYNRWLASAAHARGLSIALKNDLDQVAELVDHFDFAVNEECARYSECEALRPFIAQGKAVFHVEYDLATSTFCPATKPLQFSSMLKNWDLDAWREVCI